MKKTYINISVLIICAIAVVLIYIYDVFWLGTVYTEKLLKVLFILCSIALVFVRSNKRLVEQSLQTYESEYVHIIGKCLNSLLKMQRQTTI